MSEVLAYLRALRYPEPARVIRQHLDLTHEEVYRALVSLEARGLARMMPKPNHRYEWEAA
jgi:DNA-binding IclR family transcriptional regulator